MNKLVYLGLAIMKINKTVIYEFWQIKGNRNREKKQNYFLDTDSFIVQIITANIYVGIGKEVKARFDASNYEL